jgi:hypothetical protein
MSVRALILGTLLAMPVFPAFWGSIVPAALAAEDAGYQPQRKYVNSVEDYLDHVNSHRERVTRLGLELLRIEPEKFRDIDRSLLEKFLKSHDLEKTEPEFVTALYSRYGKSFTTSSGQKLTQTQSERSGNDVIAQLNARGKEYARRFFEANNQNGRFINAQGEYTGLANRYFLIESVADKVERYLCPVSAEEFNRAMSPASDFLEKGPGADHEAAALARELEKPGVYRRVTAGSSYFEYKARQRNLAVEGCVTRTLATYLMLKAQASPASGRANPVNRPQTH